MLQSSLHRILIVGVFTTGLSLTGAHADPLPRVVLILDQSGPGLTAYGQIVSAFRSSLDVPADPAVTIYHEKLDLNVFDGPAYQNVLATFVTEKYRDRPIGMIVALGARALHCSILLRDKQRPEIPIVFAGVGDEATELSELPPNVTGRTIQVSFENYIMAARHLVSGLRQLAVVGDPLERQGFRSHLKRALLSPPPGVEFLDLTGLPIRNVKERVAILASDSAILFTTLNVDGDGKVLTPRQALDTIARSANRPIVVDVETHVGRGAAGGFVVRPAVVGKETAELVSRVFDAGTASRIPITASDSVWPVFSWLELQKWGIDERFLPPGSDVRFRQTQMWDRYRWQIVLFTAVFLLQSFLILAFLYEDRRRRVAEAASAQLRSELAHLDRVATAGELSASIAHEIRQPLAAIVAFGTAGLRWLTRNEPDLPEARKALRTIVDEGHRAGQVIENVRAMFKNNAEPRTVLDVAALVRKTLALIPGEIRKNDIVITLELDEAQPVQVYGNEVQLRQVLLNLVTNAIDSMKSITDRPRQLRVTVKSSNPNTVSIAVEDSGPGIDPRNMTRLFDPFFSTKPSGMGLGLSICKSIVEAHDGRLTATAAGRYGAVFRIVLPGIAESMT
ncbi:MAG: GHKL domain-containing protein [Alphaproteobacteria bacterium]|nr:MAG: GHKL domain-containing protein [Alphaproteobacteria bacterium]